MPRHPRLALVVPLLLASLLPQLSVAQVRPHVGLLFSEDDIVRMRANAADPLFSTWWAELQAMDFSADNNLFREAFIYVITEDPARGQSAKEAALALADQEYWNDFTDGDQRLGFLKAGRLTMWASVAYDWLYDLMTDAEREKLRNAIAEKGCVPLYRSLHGFKFPDTVEGWSFAPYAPPTPRYNLDMSRWPHILSHNNFRAIINGGLTLGTIVLEGHDKRTREWKQMVTESISFFNGLLKDDGSYDEAVAYLNYAMSYEVPAMEAAKRHWGIDYFDSANFQGMMDYVLTLYLPSDLYPHGSINFGDSGRSLSSATGFWVARNARDGQAQFIAENYSEHDPLSLLYFDPTVRAQAPGPEANFVELDLDWIVSRSGFGRNDYVIGMRSGGPMNHEHGDRNSIQLKTYGEILIADPIRLSYWGQEDEWIMRGALGHNGVLIDGVGVQYHNGEEGTNESKSHATIVRAGQRDGYHFWTSDATQAYQLLTPDVASVTRSVISFPDYPAAVILDKVVKKGSASIVSTRWQVENTDGNGELKIGEGSFAIERPRARLYVAVDGNAGRVLGAGLFESDRRDEPFRFAEVTTETASAEVLNITVALPLMIGEHDPQISIERTGTDWRVSILKDNSVVDLLVHDRGAIPEFDVTSR